MCQVRQPTRFWKSKLISDKRCKFWCRARLRQVLIHAVTGDVGARRGLLRMALIDRYFGVLFDVLLVFTPEIRACACCDNIAHNPGVPAG
jgi:hypothetical protein